jgi:hypothetical protein
MMSGVAIDYCHTATIMALRCAATVIHEERGTNCKGTRNGEHCGRRELWTRDDPPCGGVVALEWSVVVEGRVGLRIVACGASHVGMRRSAHAIPIVG